MEELTGQQRNILDFIKQYREQHGISPSFQEIQVHFGFASPNAVTRHVQALTRKGYLLASQGRSRGLVVTETDNRGVPLVGTIAAGAPVEAIEHIEDTFDLTSLGIDNSDRQHFALRVKGNSMINAHIVDGDIVVIRKQPMVRPHDITAVFWNEEATLKYVRKQGRGLMLVPANDTMEPIPVAAENTDSFRILGKVVLTIRMN